MIYLHGFASSPGSKKAQSFRWAFEKRGAIYHIPDLNAPSFEKLTLTGILAHIAETIRGLPDDNAPVYLIGSSMGGLSALHFCDRYRDAEAARVEKVCLLAPAFDFEENRAAQMGENWRDEWREAGSIPFYHFARDRMIPVHFGLVEDLAQYHSYEVNLDMPVLIYHGLNDESVSCKQSERYAAARENVRLHLLNSDHQLLDQTDRIEEGMLQFFGFED